MKSLAACAAIAAGLVVTHVGSDTHDDALYFEGGARKPQAFGPPPTYTPYTTNDFVCLEVFGLLNMGVGSYNPGCSDGFEIHNTPEPAALALGGVGALRRRSVGGSSGRPGRLQESSRDRLVQRSSTE